LAEDPEVKDVADEVDAFALEVFEEGGELVGADAAHTEVEVTDEQRAESEGHARSPRVMREDRSDSVMWRSGCERWRRERWETLRELDTFLTYTSGSASSESSRGDRAI
jgi:hypothetical protein